MNVSSFFAELKRRNVIRMAGLYLVGAWLLTQVASTVLPMFGAPEWLPRNIVILLAIGFVPALIFSWVFELTPEGLKRDEDVAPEQSIAPQTGRRMDRLIIVVLLLALTYFAFDKFVLRPRREAAQSPANSLPNDPNSPANSKSIAVLPFVDLSESKNQEYLCDGVSEELLDTLAKIPGLRVAARTSAFSFKGKNVSVSEIGNQLGVANVIEGSLRRDGNRIRVTAQLINARTGFHVWSDTIEREIRDVFEVEDEITQAIVDALKMKLTDFASVRVVKGDSEANDLYLRGLYFSNKSGEESLRKALNFFQKALDKDPRFGRAWTGIARIWIRLADAYVKPLDAYPIAQAAAEKALALDERDAVAHGVLGFSKRVLKWDEEAMAKESKRALEIDPNSAVAHVWFGDTLRGSGDLNRAIEEYRIAARLNPLSPAVSDALAGGYMVAGRLDEAIAQGKRTLELDPAYAYLDSTLANAYREKGMFDQAIALYHQGERFTQAPSRGLGITYARAGKRREAEQVLARFLAQREKQYISAAAIGLIYAVLGNKDEAPPWVMKVFVVVIILGFPVALILAWAFELTPEGIKQAEDVDPPAGRVSENRTWIYITVIGAALAVGLFFIGRYTAQNSSSASASSSGLPEKSIAVLPFDNVIHDAETEYLSDGIAEALINSLTELQQLKVIARSTAFRYKGKQIDPQGVGRELNVRTVLMGVVRQSGDRLNVQVDLVDATTGAQLWGQEYERKLVDVLAVKQALVREVTEKLRLKLTGEQQQRLTQRDTTNPEAYQFYLRGRYYWNKRTAENLTKAMEQFQQAADKDPNYALAYVGLGDSYVLLENYAGTPANETLPKAKAFAERALQIDNSLAEAHTSLGYVYNNLWQWKEAEDEFKRAIELNPNYPTAHHWYSLYLLDAGRVAEAKAEIKRAHELDPLSLIIGTTLTYAYLAEGNANFSIAQSKKVVDLDPSFPRGHEYLGLALLKDRRYPEAIAELEKAVELSGRERWPLRDLGYGYAISGKRAEADAVIKELVWKYEKGQAIGQNLAAVYAGLGDKDQAFAWLEKDFQTRSGLLAWIRWTPAFESLRSDPRYADLLRRMGFQP